MVTADLFLLPLLSIRAHLWGPYAMKDKEGGEKLLWGSCPTDERFASSWHSNMLIFHLQGRLDDKRGPKPALSETWWILNRRE